MTTNTLMQASQNWRSRPDDQRFANLLDLQQFTTNQRRISRQGAVSSKRLEAVAYDGDLDTLQIAGPGGNRVDVNHWSFGQLAGLGKAPAGYLRTLPAAMAADCINYGLQCVRDAEDVGLLIQTDESGIAKELRAATGPNYGRIWNSEIVDALVNKFGDGVSGQWRVPGEFGQRVDITKDNTTLFASDRDMFVFLADEDNKIEIANRRDGKPGGLSRGFFLWNSEVGDKSMGAAFFLFDYTCSNRIVWGVEQFKEIRLRHTSSAPDKWLAEITPVLLDYSRSAAGDIEQHLKAAQNKKVDDVHAFLAKRYNAKKADNYMVAFERAENRPMESLWDITTGMTEYAKTIGHTDSRVEIEREAGKILAMAA